MILSDDQIHEIIWLMAEPVEQPSQHRMGFGADTCA